MHNVSEVLVCTDGQMVHINIVEYVVHVWNFMMSVKLTPHGFKVSMILLAYVRDAFHDSNHTVSETLGSDEMKCTLLQPEK